MKQKKRINLGWVIVYPNGKQAGKYVHKTFESAMKLRSMLSTGNLRVTSATCTVVVEKY